MNILQYQIIDLQDNQIIADCFSTLTDLDVYMQVNYPKIKQYGIQKYYITNYENQYNQKISLNSEILS